MALCTTVTPIEAYIKGSVQYSRLSDQEGTRKERSNKIERMKEHLVGKCVLADDQC